MFSYSQYTTRRLARIHNGLDAYTRTIKRVIPTGSEVLHFGCGRDLNGIQQHFGETWKIVGADVDEMALRQYPGNTAKMVNQRVEADDSSFDAIICEYVMEHLIAPNETFREISRLLRPGGHFVGLAPNKWSYKSIAAAMIPNRAHSKFVLTLRADDNRDATDVYPTVYKANTRSTVEHLLNEAGMHLVEFTMVDNGPTWFARIPVLFELGLCWHLAQRRLFPSLSCNFVAVATKLTKPLP